MIVKEGMIRTSIKYYEYDCIHVVAENFIESKEDAGLVYNAQDKLIGYFTNKELLIGIIKKHKILGNIIVIDIHLIDENMLIQKLDFRGHKLLPVVNETRRVIGFLLKSHYLKALAKLNKIESSRLDAIFNSAHNGIISVNLEGLITSINPPAEKMALTTKELAIGEFLNGVVSPSGLLNVLRTGKSNTEKYRVGNRLYLTHRTPIFEKKKLVGAVGVFQDISEIEFISNELETVKQLVNEMDTIINNSSDGICITDSKGNIIKKNESFNSLYFGNLSEEKKNNSFHEMIQKVVGKGSNFNIIENSMENKKSLYISAIPVKNTNNVVERVVVNVKDMTEIEALHKKLDQTQFILKKIQDDKSEVIFVTISKEMKSIVEKVQQISKVDVAVLISGESGVGKEEVANLIQKSSFRKEKPYVKVNCSTISSDFIERELFGISGEYRSGKAGVFEHLDGGTLFLDGIEMLSLKSQARVLQILQEQEVTRFGSTKSIKIDVRIIAATNKDLEDLVKKGKFLESLLFRINVVSIAIPPLRKRKEDIPELVKVYSELFSNKYKKKIKINDEALKVLMSYDWRGNIGELVSYLEQIFVVTSEETVTPEQLENVFKGVEKHNICKKKPIVVNRIMPLKEAVRELERELISRVGETEDSYRKIAKVLEVNPSTIIRKVRRTKDR